MLLKWNKIYIHCTCSTFRTKFHVNFHSGIEIKQFFISYHHKKKLLVNINKTYVPSWQKTLLGPISEEHSLLASHTYFWRHLSSFVPKDLTYVLSMAIPAREASLTESLRPMERALRDRWEKEVFRASKRFTTMFMNCERKKFKTLVPKPLSIDFVHQHYEAFGYWRIWRMWKKKYWHLKNKKMYF